MTLTEQQLYTRLTSYCLRSKRILEKAVDNYVESEATVRRRRNLIERTITRSRITGKLDNATLTEQELDLRDETERRHVQADVIRNVAIMTASYLATFINMKLDNPDLKGGAIRITTLRELRQLLEQLDFPIAELLPILLPLRARLVGHKGFAGTISALDRLLSLFGPGAESVSGMI